MYPRQDRTEKQTISRTMRRKRPPATDAIKMRGNGVMVTEGVGIVVSVKVSSPDAANNRCSSRYTLIHKIRLA